MSILIAARRSTAIFILAVLSVVLCLAQTPNRDLFSRVPAQSRTRLIERFQLMLELQNKDDRGALYDMMFGPLTKKMTRQEFINLPSSSFTYEIVSYTPRLVDQKELKYVAGASWRIVGDTKIRKRDGSEELKDGIVYAQFRDGEWYLTGVLTIETELRKVETRVEMKRSIVP